MKLLGKGDKCRVWLHFGDWFSCIQSIIFFKKNSTKIKSILGYYLFYNAQNRVCLPNTMLPRVLLIIHFIFVWISIELGLELS